MRKSLFSALDATLSSINAYGGVRFSHVFNNGFLTSQGFGGGNVLFAQNTSLASLPLSSQARADCERRVQKAKMDEAALLRAVQELRAKIRDDEKELSVVCEHIKVRVAGEIREELPRLRWR